jgi:hypothetical protein
MPECLAWLPEEILDQYRMTSPRLWEEQSMWGIMRPRPNPWDPDKINFMFYDDGEWVWAYDAQNPSRFFDRGSPMVDWDGTVLSSPDYDGEWAPVNAGLADFVAQRCLFEMAHSSVGFTVSGVVPSQ